MFAPYSMGGFLDLWHFWLYLTITSLYKLKLIWQKNLLRLEIVWRTIVDWLQYYLAPTRELRPSNLERPVVLFLGEMLQARIPRLAKWLKRSGEIDCILLVKEGKAFEVFDTEAFSERWTYRSRWHLRKLLKGLRDIHVIHAFSMPSYQIRLAITMTSIPVVMDIQDMAVSYFGLNSPKLYMRLDMPDESFSIKRADGIVSQSIELVNACQEYEIKQRPPTLMFPVYCDDDQLLTPEEVPSMGEIHLVYAGSIAGSFQEDANFGSMKLFRLIDTFTQQRIHFHIYPSPTMRFRDLILAEYQALSDRYEYFHLHESVPQKVLAEELTRYHFGLLPFFLSDTSRSAHKLGRGSSQKLYNYIESGLPVIISRDLTFQSWMASRYRAGIPIDKPDLAHLREMIEGIDYAAFRQNLLQQREKILLSQHVPRLLAFYHQIQH